MKLDDEYRKIPYFIRHTKDIRDKAEAVNNNSPYESMEDKKRLEEKESRKKDISDKKFSSILPKIKHNNNEGLDTTPIGNIEGFKFRNENKDKWINKRGFQIY